MVNNLTMPRLAMAAMGQPETQVSALCKELGITRQTLYRHVSPQGELRPDGRKLLGAAEGLRRGGETHRALAVPQGQPSSEISGAICLDASRSPSRREALLCMYRLNATSERG